MPVKSCPVEAECICLLSSFFFSKPYIINSIMQLVFLFQSFSLVAAIASLLGSTEEQEEEEEEIEESSIQRATCYWLIIRLEVGQDRCAYSAFKAL